MKYSDFQKMSEEQPSDPKVGDLFLDGKLIEQKGTKMYSGDRLVYYRIINVKKTDYGVNIEYVQVDDILEF